MKRILLLLLFIAAPAYAAQLPCTVSIDANGNATVSCAGTAVTQPPTTISCAAPLLWNGTACVLQPTPQPTPPGTCPTLPSNAVMQSMFLGGTNNYVFDDFGYRNPGNTPASAIPVGSVQVFKIPTTWHDGVPVVSATAQFASFIFYNLRGAEYEIALSKCPGDFTYYKTPAASFTAYGQTFAPCGKVSPFVDYQVSWGPEADIEICKITPGEQWYMNWRATCPPGQGHTCGQTFGVPRG